MLKIVDLRQDRQKICPNFDGYKLSLDNIPMHRQDVVNQALQAKPTKDQYSYLHMELFTMQNLLVPDPWERCSSYFVNSNNDIIKCSYDLQSGTPRQMQTVYHINQLPERIDGDYNCSLKFISGEIAVCCNGIQQMYILDTGDRLNCSREWKTIFSCDISQDIRNFLLFDARLDIKEEKKVISCALVNIAGDDSSRLLHLYCATIHQDDASWVFEVKEVLEGKGSLYYCAFEPKAESIVISSNFPVKFRSQQNGTEQTAELKVEVEDESVNYSWRQTDEDVIIKMNTLPNKQKSDYNVKCTNNKITVRCGDDVLLNKELLHMVEQDLTTWSLENEYIEITLVKKEPSIPWQYLVDGGPLEVAETTETTPYIERQAIPNLEAPIEDCDVPLATMDNDIRIERLSLTARAATHHVILGQAPPLFSTNLRPGFPDALAIRQDVDACLWLQQYDPLNPNDWGFQHEGNLHAFGYVQATKQEKKFMDCAPDLSYALVCESYRYIFLYKMGPDLFEGLRKRGSSKVFIGKQHLITLEDTGEVLGITTHECVITVLTQKCILYLQIN